MSNAKNWAVAGAVTIIGLSTLQTVLLASIYGHLRDRSLSVSVDNSSLPVEIENYSVRVELDESPLPVTVTEAIPISIANPLPVKITSIDLTYTSGALPVLIEDVSATSSELPVSIDEIGSGPFLRSLPVEIRR